MTVDRWKPNRGAFLNFWYFDQQEFYFSNGKMMLRGHNGAGKSVVMQSLLPVLMDGNKNPERLDPFSSRSRKMEDLLLGEEEINQFQERTGYIFLEYKRHHSSQYITTGMGMKAKRGSKPDYWYFIISDNRRIGKNLQLYKPDWVEGQEQKVPVTRQELEKILEGGGKVTQSPKEYMDWVNKHIFGFSSLEAYEDLIKLLIQLRSPKLSKDFKPTTIYDILNQSLPTLTEEDLRPLSETIENMDQTHLKLEQTKRDYQSLVQLCEIYVLYNQYVLLEKAEGLLIVQKQRDTRMKEVKRLEDELRKEKENILHTAKKMDSLDLEKKSREMRLHQLNQHDVFQHIDRRKHLVSAKEENQTLLNDWSERLKQKTQKENEIKTSMDRRNMNMIRISESMKDHLLDLDHTADEFDFYIHHQSAHAWKENLEQPYSFELWIQEAHAYKQKVEAILNVMGDLSKIVERYDEALDDRGKFKQQWEEVQSVRRKQENLFVEEKDRLLQRFFEWKSSSTLLNWRDEEIESISKRILSLYEPYSFEEIRDVLRGVYERHRDRIHHQKSEVQTRINQLSLIKKQKEMELESWKTKEPEPDRHPDTLQMRQLLIEKGIAFIPFYQAVEFHPSIPAAKRKRIEAALTQMGILDALIVSERNHDQIQQHDKILIPNPQKGNTLADYLYPVLNEETEIGEHEIQRVLKSIVVDHEQTSPASLTEEGSYRIGIIEGNAPRTEESLIGYETRRMYRLQQMEKLENELHELCKSSNELEKEAENLKEQLILLDEIRKQFPADKDVMAVYRKIADLQQREQILQEAVEERDEKLKAIALKKQNTKIKLEKMTSDMNIPLSEQVYANAAGQMQIYINQLYKLEKEANEYRQEGNLKKLEQQSLEEIIGEVIQLRGEINVFQSKINHINQEMSEVEQILQSMGAEEIQQKITDLMNRLQEIPKVRDVFFKSKTTSENVIVTKTKELKEKKMDVEFLIPLFEKWKESFVEDHRLGLLSSSPSHGSDEEAILLHAEKVQRDFFHLKTKFETRTQIESLLGKEFHTQQATLVEYRLTEKFIHELKDLPSTENDIHLAQLNYLRRTSLRTFISLEYRGKQLNPDMVRDQLKEEVEQQNIYLKNREKELFEEIILNNIGGMIRTQINRVEKWMDMINNLMQERQISSGIKFSLQWNPLTAEHEGELDTKKLVHLLRMDPRLMKPEDLQKIAEHFKTRISHAKELVEINGYKGNLRQIIRDLLDYRKWFSFKLFYQRNGQTRKELTNHAFGIFSGGEKALAMYTPLLSAVYSRYTEAKADAPRMITLDEAFAGVDENNIRDTFALVEELDFDYMMNSQILWGDYDTVSSLSIYDLLHPENSDYVAAVRYQWDGKVKSLIDDDDLPEDNQDHTMTA